MQHADIAIITARGGSKRIPKKNIKEFCGRPMLAYSIEAALESGLFEEVMVSTDSGEIAEIARRYGACVPFLRSKETSDDFATTADVILEVLHRYQELGREFAYACCIYPTAPFLTADTLREAMEVMETHHPVQVMPVVRFSYPPQRSFAMGEDGTIAYRFPEYIQSRSQDLAPWYHDAGQFYLYDVKRYMELNGMVSKDIMPILASELRVQDIDSEEDWKLAELKYRMMQKEKQ